MNPILDAVIALGMEEATRDVEMSAQERADFLRAKLESAVPERVSPVSMHGNSFTEGWNECRKAMLGGG